MKKRFILFSLLVLLLILPSCGSMLDQAQENRQSPGHGPGGGDPDAAIFPK
jgi:hypothetical protein